MKLMKKQNIANLVRYHIENNDGSFRKEVTMIADEFEKAGDSLFAQYLLDLVSYPGFYVPQGPYENLRYLEKKEYSTKPLFLPDGVEEDILGIARAIAKHNGMSKFLFYGKPGTGKTETAYQIARMTERDILVVDTEELIDSHLGESSKNIVKLFEEIGKIDLDRVVIVFDELDSLVMNRVDRNDLREMGRVTSTFLRELDKVHQNAVIIATTNLMEYFRAVWLEK